MGIPADVLHRTRLRSDAIRKSGSDRGEDLEQVGMSAVSAQRLVCARLS
eukprot:SAG11_NODE_38401_length_252_cov_1.013072_1_plen_48_part_10